MTESRYLEVFGNATDALLRHVGLDEAYLRSGHSAFTVETHIRHLAEARAGDELAVDTQLLDGAGKRLHLFHVARNPRNGAVLATGSTSSSTSTPQRGGRLRWRSRSAAGSQRSPRHMPRCRLPKGQGGSWARRPDRVARPPWRRAHTSSSSWPTSSRPRRFPATGTRSRRRRTSSGSGDRRCLRASALRLPALRALARGFAERAPALAYGRVRQRGRTACGHPDLRASPSCGRLPHRPRRQDALHRPRPAARVRGAPVARRLSGRLRLDPGLGTRGRRDVAVVPRPEQCPPRRSRPRHAPGRLRRPGRRARLPRHRGIHPRSRPTAATRRVVQPPTRPVRGAPGVLGSL